MNRLLPARTAGKAKPAPNSMLEWALNYAELGLQVLPLHNPEMGGCSCGNPECKRIGKHPRTAHGVKDASADPEQIRLWRKKWPDANIGIATGPDSGLLVIDVDGEVGLESLRKLHEEGCLRNTLTSITGRIDEDGKPMGWHLFFKYPDGARIRNSAGLLGRGIDVRADGGYIVAPPSLHASGRRYRLKNPERAIAMPTDQLIGRLKALQSASDEPQGTDLIYDGERNTKLFRKAKPWRRSGIAREEICRRLADLNSRMCKPPLPQEEIIQIVANLFKYVKIGPDPLQAAWKETVAEGRHSLYGRFISLARNLQRAQPGIPILLPVALVSQLMHCDRSLMTRFRKRAVLTGLMEVVEEHVPHRRATLFRVFLSTSEKNNHNNHTKHPPN